MCSCNQPNVNGQPGYSWDGTTISTHPICTPELGEHDVVLFDEPGRCGGIDSHCHHHTLVKCFGSVWLLTCNGTGTHRTKLKAWTKELEALLTTADSNTRYWLLNSFYHTSSDLARESAQKTRDEWAAAFVQKRIVKQKRNHRYSVWIEQPTPVTT